MRIEDRTGEPITKSETLIEKFERELDDFLDTPAHQCDCIGYSEGMYCCLDTVEDGDDPKNGREWLIEWLKKNTKLKKKA